MGSESDQQQKLTKKQRKALAFRDKKAGKGKGKAKPEPNALPELDSEEEQDLHKLDPNTKNLEPKTETQTLKAKGKRKAAVDDGDDKEDSETAANEVSQEKVTKKRKRIEDKPSTTVPEDDDATLSGRFEGVKGTACTLASRFVVVVAISWMLCATLSNSNDSIACDGGRPNKSPRDHVSPTFSSFKLT